jgi:hypothetical protein
MPFLDFQGMEALGRKEYDEARKYFSEALAIGETAKGVDAEMIVAKVWLSMATLAKSKGDIDCAGEIAKRAEERFRCRGRLADAKLVEEFIKSLDF